MMALFSPGSWAADKGAAAASFLLSAGLPTSGLATTGAGVAVAAEVGVATFVSEAARGWTGVAAADVAVGAAAESGPDDCLWFGSAADSGTGAELLAATG